MTSSKRDISGLSGHQFDVVIIGGGITGAWLSLHCAQQGYKTALIEKADYASQTSSASSKMLHGGIRYLQQMQFDKVRESAMERAEYIYAAPHLSKTLPFVIPTYPDFKRSKFFLRCGMLAYQALCLGENSVIESKEQRVSGCHSISADELNQICDIENEPHTGAVVFNERHMIDSERVVLAVLQSAQDLGAQVHNYVCAQEFLGDTARVTGVLARDELSGEEFPINASLVVNAAGPWIDKLNGKLRNADKAPNINSFAVGSHIVTRQLCDHAIALTTKHKANSKDISLQAEDVEQLLEAINEAMPHANLVRDDIISGFSGLYDYRTNNIKSTTYQGSGEYQIIDHQNDNKVSGLVTVLGAKFTTGRKVSAQTMKLIHHKLKPANMPVPSLTKRKLRGADYASFTQLQSIKLRQYGDQYSPEVINHLLMSYGTAIDMFIDSIEGKPELQGAICSTQADLKGQVVWAIEHEQALTLNDIIFGRTSLGLLGIGKDELTSVAELMAKNLDWSKSELKRQLSLTTSRLDKTQSAING